jgi:hypothetical protein
LIKKISITVFFLIQLSFAQTSKSHPQIPGASPIEYNCNYQDTLINQSQSVQNKFEEVFLSFNYLGIVNRTLTVNYNGVFFLPIGEIFDQLLINCTIDRRKDIIRGFYIFPDHNYEFNFNSMTFKDPDREFSFSNRDFVKKDFEYYLTADLFYKAFRLSFSINVSNLELSLATDDILPIYSKYLREQKYSYLPQSGISEKYPLLFPRDRSLLRGGFIDYTLSSSYSKQYAPVYGYDLGAGIEFLGGDLQTSARGYTVESHLTNSEFDYRWRYAFDKNRSLSQILAGDLTSTGINSYTFQGLQISNQPLEQRETFAEYLISEKTTPGSTIELYINNQLVGHTISDAAGNFHFWIPLNYGSQFIKMKYFGANGETQIIDRYYQIPYKLNPPEEFNYTIDLGKVTNSNINYLHASSIYGINDWLSDMLGIQYLENKLLNEPTFYNSLTARISSSYLLNLYAAQKAFYRISANAVYPSLTSIDLAYTKYEPNLLYNPTKIKNEINSSLNLPIYFDESPLSLQLHSQYQNFSSSDLYDIRINSSKNFGIITPLMTYSFRQMSDRNSTIKQSYISTGFLYSVGTVEVPFGVLRGILIDSNINFDLSSNKLESFFISIASNLTNTLRLQIDYNKNLIFNVTNARLQLFWEFPFTRSYSTIGKDFVTTNLQGSVLFNDLRNRISFFNREQIGRTASSFRMFIDDNANAVFDEGEIPITDAVVEITSLSSNIRIAKGETEASDLNPFTAYNVKVDESKLANPLYTAKNKIFSFEAGPNYVKSIDIPFYGANEISGNVHRVSENLRSPLSGIKVHVEGIDNDQNLTLRTFSDGAFYYFGLRPGKFKIYINKIQLVGIHCVSEPHEIEIEVEASSAGKSMENLNFDLHTEE